MESGSGRDRDSHGSSADCYQAKRFTAPLLLQVTHLIDRGMRAEELDVLVNRTHDDDR